MQEARMSIERLYKSARNYVRANNLKSGYLQVVNREFWPKIVHSGDE